MRISLATLFLFVMTLSFMSCKGPGKDHAGSEYMPDMGHSIAFEANTYFDYYLNTWDSSSVKKKYALAQPKLPVNGTVPRGYAGYYLAGQANGVDDLSAQMAAMREVKGLSGVVQNISTPVNGSVPYYYADSDDDRLRAIEDIQQNPFPITVDGLQRGKELYNVFCGVCHGEKGDGNGIIYENGAYPAAPRNFLVQEWVDTSAGLYYHAMMYGKNVMGAYKDKVSYEERWQIIHHIRALQAAEFKKTYTAENNDLVANEAVAIASNAKYAAYLSDFSKAVNTKQASSGMMMGDDHSIIHSDHAMMGDGHMPMDSVLHDAGTNSNGNSNQHHD